MTTTLTLLVVVFFSAAFGWCVQRVIRRKARSRLRRIAIAGAAAFIAFIASAALLLYQRLATLPKDADFFKDRSTYSLGVFQNPDGAPAVMFVLAFPKAVAVNDENAIDLLTFTAPTAPNAMYAADLRVGSTVQARAEPQCNPAPSGSAMPSCLTSDAIKARLPFRWIIRSEKAGKVFATVRLPNPLMAGVLAKPSWAGVVSRGDMPITKRWPNAGVEFRRPGVWDDAGMPLYNPITKGSPIFSQSGILIDISSGDFTIPLTFENTLGVSGETYDRLAVIAAVFSAMLGGGWLWPLLERLKRKPEPPSPIVRPA